MALIWSESSPASGRGVKALVTVGSCRRIEYDGYPKRVFGEAVFDVSTPVEYSPVFAG
jgi:hypothetical protein